MICYPECNLGLPQIDATRVPIDVEDTLVFDDGSNRTRDCVVTLVTLLQQEGFNPLLFSTISESRRQQYFSSYPELLHLQLRNPNAGEARKIQAKIDQYLAELVQLGLIQQSKKATIMHSSMQLLLKNPRQFGYVYLIDDQAPYLQRFLRTIEDIHPLWKQLQALLVDPRIKTERGDKFVQRAVNEILRGRDTILRSIH